MSTPTSVATSAGQEQKEKKKEKKKPNKNSFCYKKLRFVLEENASPPLTPIAI
jgi:hypothetical protein